MATPGSKFTRKKEEAIAALLNHRNMEEAAKSIGIGIQTLLRWQKIPEFQSAYLKARRDAVAQSGARLQQSTSAAVATLLKVMVDPGTPAAVRVRAADSVLNHARKAIEIEDVEIRVAALEHAAELPKGGEHR